MVVWVPNNCCRRSKSSADQIVSLEEGEIPKSVKVETV